MALDLSGGGNIGGQSFASLGLLLTKAKIPLLPSTRQVEEEIPGRDGMLDLETNFGARQIELTFQIYEKTEGDYQGVLALIAEAFNPLKGQQELVLDRNSGKRYMVKFNGNIPIDKIASIGEFTIPLKAFNPFAESVNTADEELYLGEGYTLGQGFSLESESYSFNVTASSEALTVYHAGTTYVRPVINITGSASNITITNDTTSEGMNVNVTMTSTDVLEIDCENMRVKLNGNNVFDTFSGVYPRLAPGDNDFTITSTSPNMVVDFVFRHKYLY